MCGITGKIYFNNKKIEKRQLKQMTNTIKHRGPDDSGFYISPDQKTGLGQRRLSVIDLSPLAHQPMNYMNRYWIVFNGEIYNFQEKKNLLIKQGYKFKSQSDTEVIMALYDKYGKECLQHMRGMFSIAIYDEKKQTLFCARDRIGQKPFKYYYDSSVFMFASELKTMLTQPECPKRPDYNAIHHYLTLQYTPAPLTGFKNIKKLEPGHYLFIDIKNKKIQKKRYWKLDYSKKLNLTEDEWQKKILEKIEESVKLRMIADVPLGAFLSGGIDSSAVVGFMAKNSSKPVKTFSIGFKEKKYDETKYARMIAKKFKTDHTEFTIKPEAIDILPTLVKHYEEPYADSSALPTYYLSKMTRDHVTVALNGDGGDENFAGYPRYSAQKFVLCYEKIKQLHNITALPISKILWKLFNNNFIDRSYRFSKSIKQNYKHRYLNYICYFDNEMKKDLYTSNFKEKVWQNNTYDIIAKKFNEAETKNKLDQTLYADLTTYLPEDLLAKVDIATMTVALEGRSPLLDHKLFELTCKMPFDLKLKGLNNKKYILKKALEGFIPNEILYRKKQGFGVPLGAWFSGELNEYIKANLLTKKAIKRNLFKKQEVKRLINNKVQNNANQSVRLWALLTLELWFQEYFD